MPIYCVSKLFNSTQATWYWVLFYYKYGRQEFTKRMWFQRSIFVHRNHPLQTLSILANTPVLQFGYKQSRLHIYFLYNGRPTVVNVALTLLVTGRIRIRTALYIRIPIYYDDTVKYIYTVNFYYLSFCRYRVVVQWLQPWAFIWIPSFVLHARWVRILIDKLNPLSSGSNTQHRS